MPISAYFNQNIILRLPDGQKVQNLRWMSVWNRNTSVSVNRSVLRVSPKLWNILSNFSETCKHAIKMNGEFDDRMLTQSNSSFMQLYIGNQGITKLRLIQLTKTIHYFRLSFYFQRNAIWSSKRSCDVSETNGSV